jgi:hypothetical protein
MKTPEQMAIEWLKANKTYSTNYSTAFCAGYRAALQSDEVMGLVGALITAKRQMEYTDSWDLTGNKTNAPTIEIFIIPALAAFDEATKGNGPITSPKGE